MPCNVHSAAKKLDLQSLLCKFSERLLQKFLINVERVPLYQIDTALINNNEFSNPEIRILLDSAFNQVDLENLIFRALDVVGSSKLLQQQSEVSLRVGLGVGMVLVCLRKWDGRSRVMSSEARGSKVGIWDWG